VTRIALVVLDTVRYDAFTEAFDWLPGTWFDHAYSTSHWTGDAHASLFTGQYPSEAGVSVADWSLSTPEQTLAERLSAAGYGTRAFSANINVSAPYDYDRGFDVFEGTWRLDLPKPAVFNWFRHMEENDRSAPLAYVDGLVETLRGGYDVGRSCRLGLRQALAGTRFDRTDDGARAFRETVRELRPDGPTFLFANLMEAHQPYRIPPSERTAPPAAIGPAFEATLRARFDDPTAALAAGVDPASVDPPSPDPERTRAAYDDCVGYLASVYADAFEQLQSSFDYVFTLADHGELFGEHGAWEHGYGLYEPLTHVPLVVSGPGFPDERRSDPVSLLDVHRTVLALADGVDPAGRGRDLRTVDRSARYLTAYNGIASMRREPLRERGYAPSAIDAVDVEYRGLVADDYYGFESDDGWQESGTTPDDDPREQLAALRESVPDNRARDADSGPVDPDIRQQLDALGYT
jgi:arylsulfatase A-like enzyme